MAATGFTLRCPAKINLALDVIRKREDGFHDIATVLCTIDLCDTLDLGESTDLRFSLDGGSDDIPDDHRNLVMQAARALRKEYRVTRGATLHLTKNIPSGAGLGGGSSDAACALKALNRMWNLAADSEDLARVAGAIGSDVPFFLKGGCACGTGRGEVLRPIEVVPSLDLCLIFPGVSVPTAESYTRVIPSGRPFEETSTAGMVEAVESRDMERIVSGMCNDFEEPVSKAYPEVARAKSFLLDQGAMGAMMAGSGSAVFGVFADEAGARAAKEKGAREFPWAATARTYEGEQWQKW
jgi:4-diphosphocytidyl-2-C-methyl-D-erythritol kinase